MIVAVGERHAFTECQDLGSGRRGGHLRQVIHRPRTASVSLSTGPLPRTAHCDQTRVMDKIRLASASRRHNGVLSRTELSALGVRSSTIAHKIADGEWSRPLPGVYLVWPGNPSFGQRVTLVRKWSGDDNIIFAGETAAYLHGLRTKPPDRLDVIVPAASGLRSNEYVSVRRTTRPLSGFGDPRRPPLTDTVLDLIDTVATRAHVLELLIKAIQIRMDIDKFIGKMNKRKRLKHRRYLTGMLEITELGVESHLELAYLRQVERAHGLPHSEGQKRERIAGRWIRSDRWHKSHKVRIELDGELAHPGRATDDDVMRDNEVRIVLDEITLRFRWPHVTLDPCRVAAQVVTALAKRGWTGTPRTCGPNCTMPRYLTQLQLKPTAA